MICRPLQDAVTAGLRHSRIIACEVLLGYLDGSSSTVSRFLITHHARGRTSFSCSGTTNLPHLDVGSMASSFPSARCGHVDALAVTCACDDSACLVCATRGFSEAPDAGTEGRPQPREFDAWCRCDFCADWFCAACDDSEICAICFCRSCETCSRVQIDPQAPLLDAVCLSCSQPCATCGYLLCSGDEIRTCGSCLQIFCYADHRQCSSGGGLFCESSDCNIFSCDDCNRVRVCVCEGTCLCADHSIACACGVSWLCPCSRCQEIKCGVCKSAMCESCPWYDCSYCDTLFCAECTGDGLLCDFCDKYSCSTCRQVRPCSSCSKLVCEDESVMCGRRQLCGRGSCVCACISCALRENE